MRAILFRVWTDGKMFYPHEYNKTCGSYSSIGFSPENRDGETCFMMLKAEGGFQREWKEQEIMQFSGLFDKNKVKIYEGDILYSRYDDKQEEKGYSEVWNEVIFQNGAFGWRGETTGGFHSFHDEPLNESAEVVGNICQNRELLSSKPN